VDEMETRKESRIKKFYLQVGREVEHSLRFGVDKKLILKAGVGKWVRGYELDFTGTR
jgi:hypothetical protein